jgi:tubulin polyglutamylase TTLL1/tubulin monoglycylase TTLL3/8
VQKYIDDILLYRKRKFDIRCFMMVTFHNGVQRAYWYEEGYIRTSSQEFNLGNVDDLYIHLTNDAIQKKGSTYGKYEAGNKVSFQEFDQYMNSEKHEKSFLKDIYPQLKVDPTYP